MATALACTFQAGTVSQPPRVLLAVTGAPAISGSYTSNFATVDGWTVTGITQSVILTVPQKLLWQGTAFTGDAQRTVTGLVVGQVYKFVAVVEGEHGVINQLVTGMSAGPQIKPADFVKTTMTYTFTATATSHVIRFQLATSPGSTAYPKYWIHSVSVKTTTAWQGTTITRTDANGTNVVVREGPGGQDTAGTTGSATMTVYDYEAALTGLVTYTVTDGLGATATANHTPPAGAGVWITLPATSDPSLSLAPPTFVPVDLITGYRGSAESNGTVHKIVGRADPIANPGPLAYRRGSVELWCADYATALKLETLFAGGAVAQLRQPTFPGLDMYVYATDVDLAPEDTAPVVRWIATIGFQEVTAP